MRQLPPGMFLYFKNLSPDTTEEEIRALILARTGVNVGPARVSIRHDPTVAIVSLEKPQVTQIMDWALSNDTLHGCAMRCYERRVPVFERSGPSFKLRKLTKNTPSKTLEQIIRTDPEHARSKGFTISIEGKPGRYVLADLSDRLVLLKSDDTLCEVKGDTIYLGKLTRSPEPKRKAKPVPAAA